MWRLHLIDLLTIRWLLSLLFLVIIVHHILHEFLLIFHLLFYFLLFLLLHLFFFHFSFDFVDFVLYVLSKLLSLCQLPFDLLRAVQQYTLIILLQRLKVAIIVLMVLLNCECTHHVDLKLIIITECIFVVLFYSWEVTQLQHLFLLILLFFLLDLFLDMSIAVAKLVLFLLLVLRWQISNVRQFGLVLTVHIDWDEVFRVSQISIQVLLFLQFF